MRILGINGGNGVILYPMKKYVIGNVEIRSVFKTPNDIQWGLNFPDIPLITKASEMTRITSCDVIVAAPNCGHSSILAYSRAKKLSDPMKDDSFELFLTSIKFYKPKVFMMENLPKVLDMVPKQTWYKTFPEYELIFHTLSVSEWGNSQKTRIRLVLIGLKKEVFKDNLSKAQYHFSTIYKLKEPKICKDLLAEIGQKEIPEIGHIRENINDIITMYSGFKISLKKAQKFWLDNPTLKRWPVNDRKFTTAPGVYRNLETSYPAVARKANRQFNAQGLQMSPKELATIQGIPKRFKIYMDLNRKTFSINKARITVTKTPPYEIPKWFYKQLKKIEQWI